MKTTIEYETNDPHSIDSALYTLHLKWPQIIDYLFLHCHILFESDDISDLKLEALIEYFDKLKIYNDLMAYKLAINTHAQLMQGKTDCSC